MFYYIQIIIILFLAINLSCKPVVETQNSKKHIQIETHDDKKIKLYIKQLSSKEDEERRKAVELLINIARESKLKRDNVIKSLIIQFDIFRSDKNQFIMPEERPELDAYLKLFLELNSVNALDVMVKYINSRELISSMDTIIAKTVSQFGEDAILSLENGLNSNRDEMFRCRCAMTLSSLKFKRNKEVGINKTVEVLEKAKKNAINEKVIECIDQSILTLHQRKLPNYPLKDY